MTTKDKLKIINQIKKLHEQVKEREETLLYLQ